MILLKGHVLYIQAKETSLKACLSAAATKKSLICLIPSYSVVLHLVLKTWLRSEVQSVFDLFLEQKFPATYFDLHHGMMELLIFL